jgi:serine/threonine-protein kinase
MYAGLTVGRYEVLSRIGAGGMGEVWRAQDTSLHREVALKALPPAVASDPDRLKRFQREARILASLNHANIAVVYGLEQVQSQPVLAMELVDGETLADILRKGPLSLRRVLEIGVQTAAAIEAVHVRGIAHRDLKPSNIMIGSGGQTKVLDFGIAKPIDLQDSEVTTDSSWRSEGGLLQGTIPYMSPEQLSGRPADARSDIWSFGCILFECLTGKQPFRRPTMAATITAILTEEPDWAVLPPDLPPTASTLLRLTLEKDTSARLQHAGDARLLLQTRPSSASAAERRPSPILSRRTALLAGTLLLLAVVAGVWLSGRYWATTPPNRSGSISTILRLDPQPSLLEGRANRIAISPNGQQLLYVGTAANQQALFLRSIDQLTAVPIPGTAGADGPFFSPDGDWVGFFAEGKLKKVRINRGQPVALADAADPRGGHWGDDGFIVFASTPFSGLTRISQDGGTPQLITELIKGERQTTHRWPYVVPGGRAVLFVAGTAGMTSFDDATICYKSLDSGVQQVVARGTAPRILPGGYLAFARGKTVFAARFDAVNGRVLSAPAPILDDVGVWQSSGRAMLDVSQAGIVAYLPFSFGARAELAWFDSTGWQTRLSDQKLGFRTLRLSRDGTRLATDVLRATSASDIWAFDITRSVFSRLTFDGLNSSPVWSPDGAKIAFASSQRDGSGVLNLYVLAADGGSTPTLMSPSPHPEVPSDWSPDNKLLLFTTTRPGTGDDVWAIAPNDPASRRALLDSPFNESDARFSPDGYAIAYESNESGRGEVYVRTFPDLSRKLQVSNGGGSEPVWSASGDRLYYRGSNGLFETFIATRNALHAGPSRKLFEMPPRNVPLGWAYDVDRTTGRVVAIGSPQTDEIRIIVNWLQSTRDRLDASERSAIQVTPQQQHR